MENDSRFKEWTSKVSEFLNDQTWFQSLKGKWEELDPNSRQYLKTGGAAASVLLVFTLLVSSVWSVHALKSELTEKQDLLSMIQTANDELRRLRDITSSSPAANGAGAGGTWPSYFETVGTSAGLDKTMLTIGDEKAGTSSDMARETLYSLSVKHVSIKQVVRYAFGLENGNRPVKLRNLQIDTKGDPTGYMDATLSVSAFALVNK